MSLYKLKINFLLIYIGNELVAKVKPVAGEFQSHKFYLLAVRLCFALFFNLQNLLSLCDFDHLAVFKFLCSIYSPKPPLMWHQQLLIYSTPSLITGQIRAFVVVCLSDRSERVERVDMTA